MVPVPPKNRPHQVQVQPVTSKFSCLGGRASSEGRGAGFVSSVQWLHTVMESPRGLAGCDAECVCLTAVMQQGQHREGPANMQWMLYAWGLHKIHGKHVIIEKSCMDFDLFFAPK